MKFNAQVIRVVNEFYPLGRPLADQSEEKEWSKVYLDIFSTADNVRVDRQLESPYNGDLVLDMPKSVADKNYKLGSTFLLTESMTPINDVVLHDNAAVDIRD